MDVDKIVLANVIETIYEALMAMESMKPEELTWHMADLEAQVIALRINAGLE